MAEKLRATLLAALEITRNLNALSVLSCTSGTLFLD